MTGNAAGNKIDTKFKIDLPESREAHSSLPVLWARARIRHLTNRELGNISGKTRDEITDIGLRYQIATDYTSFIAVERDIPGDISKKLITRDVLAAIPEGMEHLFEGNSRSSNQYVPSQNNGGNRIKGIENHP